MQAPSSIRSLSAARPTRAGARRAGALAARIVLFAAVLHLSCAEDPAGPGPSAKPTARFTASPPAGEISTLFQFDASASSDPEGPSASLQVRWNWEDDGAWDTEWSASKTAGHSYGGAGVKSIRLEVRDSGGRIDDTTGSVTVTDTDAPPHASFTVHPSSGTTTTLFQFDASGSSDDRDPGALLEVRWDWEDDGSWDTDWSATKTATRIFDAAGAFTIRLEARDSGDLTDDTTRSIVVTEPAPPPENMVLVPPGTFVMGSAGTDCEDPHEVTLTRAFYLGTREVTNAEYREALQWAYDRGYAAVETDLVLDRQDAPSFPAALVRLAGPGCGILFDGSSFTVVPGMEDHPMVQVTWCGAAAYCDWLSLRAGLPRAYDHSTWRCNDGDPYGAAGFRLPTDAEWEYAAQYGGNGPYPWGGEEPDCGRADWCDEIPCVGSTVPVGSYPAAPALLGLYDLAGNAWEFCDDAYVCRLGGAAEADPTRGASGDADRVQRGGSWESCGFGLGSYYLRSAYRGSVGQEFADEGHGFRCARGE